MPDGARPDDEDLGDDPVRGRFTGGRDFSSVFRVWRLRDGTVEELEDPFLFPVEPEVGAF